MKSAILLSSLAYAEGGNLKLAWKDCGAAHGKVTGLTPDTLALGTKTTATGTGTVDEAVSGGSFEIDLKASIISQTYKGDVCTAKSFSLPLGTGTIKWDGLKCPVAAGSVDVPMDITLSASLPGPLQSVALTVKGAATNGDDVFCMQINTSPASDDWEDFKQQFQKSYASDEEESYRKGIFGTNVEFINSENARQSEYELGVNQFSDLLVNEWSAQYFGMAKPEKPFGDDVPYLGRHQVGNETLASSVDWTTKGAVTPVKNQGQCGSCWSFSATGSMEGAYEIANRKLVSVSEQQLVDCAQAEGEQGCNGGLMDGAFKYAKKTGMCTEASYPYKAKGGKCKASSCTKAFAAGVVTGYKDVSTDSEQSLMSAVAKNPVSIAIEADKSVFQQYKSGVLSGMCGSKLDHGVLVVGYGTDPSGGDYWKVKNSWGASWGDHGYVRLKRGKGGAGECGILSDPSYPIVKGSAEIVV